MRIFVSSSFEDLREHRAAAIRVLRQLGHEVLAMEDMIAGSAAPLAKVIEMVDRSEAYVGVFAWRYGYVPGRGDPPTPTPANIPQVAGASTDTSITHYEYLRAVQRKLPILAFLLDEHYPWPPDLVDGFDKTRAQAPPNADKIRNLRAALQQERVVSWFTTPSDLEARVSAAVTMAGLTSQLDLQAATALPSNTGVAGDSGVEFGITEAIIAAGDHQRALKIYLGDNWWSTRLYLIASLAERLTQARRILVVASRIDPKPAAAVAGPPPVQAQPAAEIFVGQLSTSAILSNLGPRVPELGKFAEWLRARPLVYNEVRMEIQQLLVGWRDAFGADSLLAKNAETAAKIDLTAEVLRRWFGDAMLQQEMRIADLQRASIVDILRLLDYPNDYVPVLTLDIPAAGQPAIERVNVVDKGALNARLARNYLVELLDRARIV
jgi:hypothetical protein